MSFYLDSLHCKKLIQEFAFNDSWVHSVHIGYAYLINKLGVMVNFVTLRKNGILISHKEGKKPVDVSDCALEFLFEPCKLGRDIVLKDLFLLMQKSPTLIDVFSRYGAREQVDDALSVHEELITVDTSPGSVEYLELYKAVDGPWDDKYELWPGIGMRGIGYAFTEDTVIDGHTHLKGSRIAYTMVGSPPKQSVSLPLRLDSSSLKWLPTELNGKPRTLPSNFKHLNLGLPYLGEVIQGVLYEFSYFGASQAQEEFIKKLANQTDWVDLEEELC